MYCCTFAFSYQFCLLSWQIERALNIDRLTLTKQIDLQKLRTSHINQENNDLFIGIENSDEKSQTSEKRRGCMARPWAPVYTGVCSESAAFHIR